MTQWGELKKIRVRSYDSAYVYAILEAHEGVVAYGTLPHVNGSPYRDLELQIPASMKEEARILLDRLRTDLGEDGLIEL